jgi:hypothetical protein
LIEEHRKLYGDFEVIDYVDETVIQKLRDDIDVESPITLHWTWNYASENDVRPKRDSERLSAKAIRGAGFPLRESRALENSEQHYSRAATGFLQKRSN